MSNFANKFKNNYWILPLLFGYFPMQEIDEYDKLLVINTILF